jgi:hypothetical protein
MVSAFTTPETVARAPAVKIIRIEEIETGRRAVMIALLSGNARANFTLPPARGDSNTSNPIYIIDFYHRIPR